MAKLGGERKALRDIRTPFTTSPGGRVTYLEPGLQFLISAIGTAGINSIHENVSQRVLTSSASPSFNTDGTGEYFPTRFKSTAGFTVPLKDNNAYPSYLKEEQTIAVFVGNVSDPSSVLTPQWSSPSPNYWKDAGGGTQFPKYPEDRIVGSYQTSSGSASGSYLLTNSILFTSASITSGSHTIAVSPFLFAQRRVYTPENTDYVSYKTIPVLTYRDWILDSTKGIKLRTADIVACGMKLNSEFDVPDIRIEQYSVGDQPAYETYFDRGRSEKRVEPAIASGWSVSGDLGWRRNVKLTGWDPNGGSDEFHLVVFRQRLGSTATGDPGYMDVSVDGEIAYQQRSYQDLPEGASRFTIEDLLTATSGSVTIPGTIRALRANPRVLGLGNFTYCFAAGWNRCLTDDEIKSLSDAMKNGVFTQKVTSTTANVLSPGYSLPADDHYLDSSLVINAPNNVSEKSNIGSFSESSIVNEPGSVTIEIPIVTQDDPHNLGLAYRNHGDCKVGQTLYGQYITRNGAGRNRSYGSTTAIHGTGMKIRNANIDGAFGPATIQIERMFTNNEGSSKPRTSANNVGTGFLYYSPKKKCWIEKRPSHATHKSNAEDYNYLSLAENEGPIRAEVSGTEAVLGLEYNNDTPLSTTDPGKLTFHITGANRILSQFCGSPNIGYILPWKRMLENFSYKKIGWPTSTFGAPADAKYHAFDDETIKLTEVIDRPFILQGVELELNIEASRMFVTQSATNSAGVGHTESWAKYVMNRRDIENYSFFLYRQRRRGGSVKDTNQDISGSERFLIASASLAFYNSASFGGSHKDGYWQQSALYSASFAPSTDIDYNSFANIIYEPPVFGPTGTLVAPDFTSNYRYAPYSLGTRWTEPLHGPAFQYNWGVDFTTQSVEIMRSKVNLKMTPAIAPYGPAAPSMMTFLGGKLGTYTTQSAGFINSGDASIERPAWFHTGVFADPFVNKAINPSLTHAGSGTYAYPLIHFWYGSTRIPQVFVEGSKSNRIATRNLVMNEGSAFDVTSSGDPTIGPYQNPRQNYPNSYTSAFSSLAPSFSQYTYQNENQSTSKIDEPPMNFISDGRALSSPTRLPGTDPDRESSFGIDILSRLDALIALYKTYGRGAIFLPPNTDKAYMKETEYLLLPGDELVLGLENSNFGVPDYTPFVLVNTSSLTSLDAVGFLTGVYKDAVLDYLPYSYMRVLPGIGKIRLIGRYLRDNESYFPQDSSSGDITTVIGDVPYDQFNVTETDGYYGGIFDEIITGSVDLTSQPYRGVAGHATTGDIKGNFSLNRFFTVYTDRYVRDYFDDPVRNTLRTTGSLPGSTTYGYKIPQKAVLSSVHYGYLRDFLETPPNQVLAPRLKDTPFNDATVTVKFIEKSSTQFNDVNEFQKSQTSPLSVQGTITTSQNVSRTAALDGPYKDGEFTDRDAIEYTVTV